jgi:hypothetical protein
MHTFYSEYLEERDHFGGQGIDIKIDLERNRVQTGYNGSG